MELLAGAACAESVDPFPEPSVALICHEGPNPAAGVVCPGEVVHCRRPKLKPIRCAARSPPETPEGRGGLRVRASDDGSEGSSGAGIADAVAAAAAAAEEEKPHESGLGSELGEWSGDPDGPERFWEESWCLSSDEGNDASADVGESDNRKRKRRTRKKLEFFMKNTVMRLMAKQEQMHQELVQMLERMERERIIREEAWHRQEIELIKRNERLRAQGTSRSLALISFVEKLMGHQAPPQLNSLSVVEDEDENQGSKDIEFDLPNSANRKPNNERWPASEVQALIALRASLETKLQTGFKGSIWEEISHRMSDMGYKRTTKKCREKWDNINKYFKKSIAKGKDRLANSKSCPYFHDLDVLYKAGLMDSTNALGSSSHKQE